MIPIKVKKLHADAIMPKQAYAGDACFDLYALQNTMIPHGRCISIPTGLAFEIPEGYEGQIRGRSGLTSEGLLVQLGTIDSGYRGHVLIAAIYHHTKRNHYTVQRGQRIAQIAFREVPQVELMEVMELGQSGRGTKGYGSSGV